MRPGRPQWKHLKGTIKMAVKDIAIYGAGGFGREVACMIHAINRVEKQWHLIGFFDDGLPRGYENGYGPLLGGMTDLNQYSQPLALVMAIGAPHVVARCVGKISNPNISFPNLISPDLWIADTRNFAIGEGNFIGGRCIFSCNVTIGSFNAFNGDVMLGHDVVIQDYNALMPSVRVSGGVQIGTQNLIGGSAVILPGISIGKNTTIASNSLIVKSTKDSCSYIGNPARRFAY